MKIKKYFLIFITLFTFTLADIVITNKEVIRCTLLEADKLYVRVRLPEGGIRVIKTEDVYEIRLSDFSRVEEFADKLPGVRVVPDTGRVFAPPKIKEEEKPTIDPVASGNYLLGGSGSYTITSISGQTSSIISLTPQIGYFLARGIAVGGEINLTSVSFGEMRQNTVAFGPKILFAIGSQKSSGFFLGEVSLSYSSGIAQGSNVIPGSGTRTSFAIGYLPFINNHLCIPIKLSLFIDKIDNVSATHWVFSIGLYGIVAQKLFQ